MHSDAGNFPQEARRHPPRGAASTFAMIRLKAGGLVASLWPQPCAQQASARGSSLESVMHWQASQHEAACPQVGPIEYDAAHHDKHEAVPLQAGPQEADNVLVRARFQQRDLTGKASLQPQASR